MNRGNALILITVLLIIWGLNNDYVQHEIARDLRFQLGQSDDVKVLTDQEARSNNIHPDEL